MFRKSTITGICLKKRKKNKVKLNIKNKALSSSERVLFRFAGVA